MNVPEIIEVKKHLTELKAKKLISTWELPYENILTRRSAAVFFLDFEELADKEKVWKDLERYEHFCYQKNTEQILSKLAYQITFSKEEKDKIQKLSSSVPANQN